jgi:hypothetical protein
VLLHRSLSVLHGSPAIELLSLPHRKRSPSISLLSIAGGPFLFSRQGWIFNRGDCIWEKEKERYIIRP